MTQRVRHLRFEDGLWDDQVLIRALAIFRPRFKQRDVFRSPAWVVSPGHGAAIGPEGLAESPRSSLSGKEDVGVPMEARMSANSF